MCDEYVCIKKKYVYSKGREMKLMIKEQQEEESKKLLNPKYSKEQQKKKIGYENEGKKSKEFSLNFMYLCKLKVLYARSD